LFASLLAFFVFQKLRQCFDQLDVDKNGHLTAAELHLLFTLLLKIKVSFADVQAMVKAADTSGNGQIEFDEFLVVRTPLRPIQHNIQQPAG